MDARGRLGSPRACQDARPPPVPRASASIGFALGLGQAMTSVNTHRVGPSTHTRTHTGLVNTLRFGPRVPALKRSNAADVALSDSENGVVGSAEHGAWKQTTPFENVLLSGHSAAAAAAATADYKHQEQKVADISKVLLSSPSQNSKEQLQQQQHGAAVDSKPSNSNGQVATAATSEKVGQNEKVGKNDLGRPLGSGCGSSSIPSSSPSSGAYLSDCLHIPSASTTADPRIHEFLWRMTGCKTLKAPNVQGHNAQEVSQQMSAQVQRTAKVSQARLSAPASKNLLLQQQEGNDREMSKSDLHLDHDVSKVVASSCANQDVMQALPQLDGADDDFETEDSRDHVKDTQSEYRRLKKQCDMSERGVLQELDTITAWLRQMLSTDGVPGGEGGGQWEKIAPQIGTALVSVVSLHGLLNLSSASTYEMIASANKVKGQVLQVLAAHKAYFEAVAAPAMGRGLCDTTEMDRLYNVREYTARHLGTQIHHLRCQLVSQSIQTDVSVAKVETACAVSKQSNSNSPTEGSQTPVCAGGLESGGALESGCGSGADACLQGASVQGVVIKSDFQGLFKARGCYNLRQRVRYQKLQKRLTLAGYEMQRRSGVKQPQEYMRSVIQKAAERTAPPQEVMISGKPIQLSALLAAIKAKGMDNGLVVWVQLAQVLDIDVKRNHNYSLKLMQLLQGTLSKPNEGCDHSRKKSGSKSNPGQKPMSKGILTHLFTKPKAPVLRLISRMPSGKVLEEELDHCNIRNDVEGSYITLKLRTGENSNNRAAYTHFLPKRDCQEMVSREVGTLAKSHGLLKTAAMARSLWVQQMFESVARSDALQERLKRQRLRRQVNVKAWDMSILGLLIEAAAVGQGLLYWSMSKLCCDGINLFERFSQLGVLSDGKERMIRRSLAQVNRDIAKDPRICCLCRIVGDAGVQGRLLYVEANCWAHVNCVCWSKGVYQLTIQKNMLYSKIGLLCNVHDAVRKSGDYPCDFCGCPGATVVCAAMGCCSTSHFGCAVLDKWSFYSENIPLCGSCAVSPAAKACGGLGNALAPINLYKLTSRHLRVMPHKPNKAVCNAAAGTASGGQAGYSAHSAAFHTSTIPATTSTQQEPPQTLSSLKGEQWGLYQESVRGGLINVKGGLIQQASMMPRIGALTVLRLGVVKTDQRHHPDQAIYPIGYTSNRVCFAPGEIQTKSSIARPRALYTCQILAGEHGGPPHFKVAVGAEVCYASSTSEAWQRATRRSMRSLKTGDCMFGVTLQPIARILWAAGAGGGERESQETIVENHPLSIKKRKIGSSYDDQS